MKRILPMFLAVILIFSLSVTAFADEYDTMPIVEVDTSIIPSVDGVYSKELYPFAVIAFNDEEQIWLTVCTAQFWQLPAGKITPYVHDSITSDWKTFKLSSSGNWVAQSSGTGDVQGAKNVNYLIYSTHDVKSYSGSRPVVFAATPNFFKPLAEVVRGVAEETLTTQTLPALGGVMKILAACGVGLVALLMVLHLFGKRSLISIRR